MMIIDFSFSFLLLLLQLLNCGNPGVETDTDTVQ